ncbi:MAG TPA: glycosyltransferase family 4 protein [Vicinamibacterales bacterium]|nr:glycosyltransferase family 4 protein [Vicinamibacterales bacterium]
MTGILPDRPLRIGISASYDLGRAGGVNTHIRAQAAALRRLGHDVCIFGASSAPLSDGEISLCGCVSLVIGHTETGFGIDPRSWWSARRLLRSRQFDVLHMHEPLMPLPSWFVLRQAEVPVVATFHTYREHGHKWYPRYRRLFEPLVARIAVRLAVSEAATRTVATHFPGDYEIVPNAIEVCRFATPVSRPASMPDGRPYVLYVGRLEPRKGVDRLLRAMTVVRRQVPCAQLVIVGEGPDREALESEACALNVDVQFVGHVSDDDLPGFYRSADVVCSPALRDESFGIVLLEAMAAGRPIVATNIAGYAELLRPAGCARFADVEDVDALAREISAVLVDRPLARTLGERGAIAAQRYDWGVVAKRLEEIYYSAIGSLQAHTSKEPAYCVD